MSKYSVSIDGDGDHNLVLKFWDHSKPFSEAVSFEAKIPPMDQSDLMTSLVNRVAINLRSVANDLVLGDCPTCRNFRLVDVGGPGGRMSNKYCPDCRPKGREWPTPFEHYPIHGGGLAPREEI